MKLGVVGSRAFPDPRQTLISVIVRYAAEGQPFTIVSGGAPGVDQLAVDVAHGLGYKAEVIPADWANLGKRAGVVRNAEIVAEVDAVVALWDGKSPGTRNTIDNALKQRKHLEVIFPTG